jgi:hypothetical protein
LLHNTFYTIAKATSHSARLREFDTRAEAAGEFRFAGSDLASNAKIGGRRAGILLLKLRAVYNALERIPRTVYIRVAANVAGGERRRFRTDAQFVATYLGVTLVLPRAGNQQRSKTGC